MNAAGFEEALKEKGLSVSDGSRYENVTEHSPLDTRRCVTALNALVEGIAVRTVIFEHRGHIEFEVRVDGYPTPNSPVGGFSTVSQTILEAKASLLRWVGEVLERV